MTTTNMIWAIAVALAGTCFGISIMFGHIPGLASEIGTFRRVAALAKMAVDEYGYLLTGLGTIVSGMIVGVLCVAFGKGSPDSGLGTD